MKLFPGYLADTRKLMRRRAGLREGKRGGKAGSVMLELLDTAMPEALVLCFYTLAFS